MKHIYIYIYIYKNVCVCVEMGVPAGNQTLIKEKRVNPHTNYSVNIVNEEKINLSILISSTHDIS